jgi:hypothetical protein
MWRKLRKELAKDKRTLFAARKCAILARLENHDMAIVLGPDGVLVVVHIVQDTILRPELKAVLFSLWVSRYGHIPCERLGCARLGWCCSSESPSCLRRI